MIMYDLLLTALEKNKKIELLVSAPIDQPMGVEIFNSTCWNYDETAFSQCTQSEIEQLLVAFLNGDFSNVGYSVAFELAKTLCLYGSLVVTPAEKLLLRASRSIRPPLKYSLYWAYFGSNIAYEHLCCNLVKDVPEDFRDGIFIACFNLNTKSIYETMVPLFMKWMEDPDWGNGTGEMGALDHFLKKWDMTDGFNDHKRLYQVLNNRL